MKLKRVNIANTESITFARDVVYGKGPDALPGHFVEVPELFHVGPISVTNIAPGVRVTGVSIDYETLYD